MKIVSLADMKVGQSGIVEALEGRGNIQHRLVDMGVVKGSRISVFKKAPLGDPVEVKIKGCAMALRMNEAAMISVAWINKRGYLVVMENAGKIKVALAGNPNCGKTTIFNNITGSKQHVATIPRHCRKEGRPSHL